MDRGNDDGLASDVAEAPSNAPDDRGTGPLKRDLVAGLEKGLTVIEAFDQERPRLTISEVAERTGLTRAAARRYLITLAHLGFVSQDRKMFALTPRVLRLAQSYMHSARLPRIVQPELHKLAHELKEASAAGVLDGDDVISIAANSAGRLVSLTLQAGTRVPAYCTSNGRVLLASLDAHALEDRIAPQRLRSLTPHTIVQPDLLRAELARVRTQGYAVVDQELEINLRTVAVPLRNYRGETVAALNVSVHATRMTVSQLVQTALPPLLQAQAQLRQLL